MMGRLESPAPHEGFRRVGYLGENASLSGSVPFAV